MEIRKKDHIGVLVIDSPNNNSINRDFVREASGLLDEVGNDDSLSGLVITSTHPKIFSPGLNLVELATYSFDEMSQFMESFTGLFFKEFGFPKPLVMAVNGHAIAGGCLIALPGDYRFMAKGEFQVSLAEINLAIPIPIGTMGMLKYFTGPRNAEHVVYSGDGFLPDQALSLGLIDELVEPGRLLEKAMEKAKYFCHKSATAFEKDKMYLRKDVLEWMEEREPLHRKEWLDNWFSKECEDLKTKVIEGLSSK